MQTTYPDRTRTSLSRGARRQSAIKVALEGAVGVVAFLALIPMGYLLIRAAQKPLNESMALLFREKTLQVLATTSILVFSVLVLTLLIGVSLAPG